LELGWFNGWILICLIYFTYGVLLFIFPKDVVARLYDKSGRTKRQHVLISIGSLLAFAYFVLIIVTPLKIGSDIFIPGLALYFLGLVGFIVALFNFKNAPADQPVTKGLYRISRNPQQLSFFISFIGICVAISSWSALFIQMVSCLFFHV
jgi:protein-S-isoprenylcysteine O-methyltransferase Ste14